MIPYHLCYAAYQVLLLRAFILKQIVKSEGSVNASGKLVAHLRTSLTASSLQVDDIGVS